MFTDVFRLRVTFGRIKETTQFLLTDLLREVILYEVFVFHVPCPWIMSMIYVFCHNLSRENYTEMCANLFNELILF